ncbi:HalOD1 output domain-containing protein [Natrinema sp. 1APR25-10V2]|uniref:HalOD1 output domain-containing protein n=1 Tax=Natrinema sp. 1APR25-10V2 TaxID=2951081 RepID=UPI002874EE86|nr:HalOD1 output domain-containing protein [Natrinema sp. 1APR25-10V2]MDS0476326.1 hypothetical protein [Natrinema sp. 1APR25-10V2]
MNGNNHASKRDRATFADESLLSLRIVGAVANAMDIDPVDCPPLFEAIDPLALDTLFEGKESRGTLVFEYAGHVVTVDSEAHVTLAESDGP